MPDSILKKLWVRFPFDFNQRGEPVEPWNKAGMTKTALGVVLLNTTQFSPPECRFQEISDVLRNHRLCTFQFNSMADSYLQPSGLYSIDPRLSHLLLACGLFETL